MGASEIFGEEPVGRLSIAAEKGRQVWKPALRDTVFTVRLKSWMHPQGGWYTDFGGNVRCVILSEAKNLAMHRRIRCFALLSMTCSGLPIFPATLVHDPQGGAYSPIVPFVV